MKLIYILTLLSIIASGCISTQIEKGNTSQYEFPGVPNTTIFYLNLSSIEVIYNVVNKTTVDFRIEDRIETFKNPAAIDYSGRNASMNVSIISNKARNYAHFNFSSNFTGYVAFTRPGGQDFSYVSPDNSTIRVVLPENFTTGTLFIGYISPEPDNITIDSKGRQVLIWNNTTNEKIRVRYYQKDTPMMLMYLFTFLLACAVLIWGYYYSSISKLVKKRKMLEKDIRK